MTTFSEKLDRLRDMLSGIDWYYQYAEGQRYHEGRAAMERVERLRDELLREAGEGLMNSFKRNAVIMVWNTAAPEGREIYGGKV